MAKIIVFALLGLTIIGFLGWMLGNPQHPQQLVHYQQHYQQQDSRFPTAVITAGKTRLKPEMLAIWMQRGAPSILLVDTRPVDDFQDSHLQHAINRQLATLLTLRGLRRLPRHKPIILYGGNDEQNARAVDVMRSSGLTAFYLPGKHDVSPRLVDVDDEIATMVAAGSDTHNQIAAPVDPVVPSSEVGRIPSVSASSGVTQISELATSTLHVGILDDSQGH
jgi:rhodanese-related sulfurtransferase